MRAGGFNTHRWPLATSAPDGSRRPSDPRQALPRPRVKQVGLRHPRLTPHGRTHPPLAEMRIRRVVLAGHSRGMGDLGRADTPALFRHRHRIPRASVVQQAGHHRERFGELERRKRTDAGIGSIRCPFGRRPAETGGDAGSNPAAGAFTRFASNTTSGASTPPHQGVAVPLF